MGMEATFKVVDNWNFLYFLPGKNYGTDADEYITVNSHSDAMNLVQDNGALGTLGIFHYFSQILQIDPACRSTPENDCPWLALPLHIDPTLFQRYGVGATPALVFDNGQDQWLIHGDAGLAVLLDEIAKAAKSQALHLITKRLRGSH